MLAAVELPIDVGKDIGALLAISDALAGNKCGHDWAISIASAMKR